MKTTSASFLFLVLLQCCATASADRIEHPKGIYSFDVPSGWKALGDDAFSIEGAGGEDFVELAAPRTARSVAEISRASTFVASAMGFDKPGKDAVQIEGKDWKGTVSYVNGKYGPKKTPSTLLIFTLKGPERFYSFWLIADTALFAKQEAEYLEMFKTLEFRPEPVEAPAVTPTPAETTN